MTSSTFSDYFANVDSVLTGVFAAASAGMSNYILPVGWVMFGISILVWAFLVMNGKIDSPISDWMMKGIVIILILYAAGNYYGSWISGPIWQLPTDLSHAIGTSGNASQVLDSLDDKVENLINGIATAMVDNFGNLNIGGGVVLLVALVLVSIASILLLVAAAYNILYAKIGLTVVLSFGPFFVIWLIWKQTQQWFWSWLNTALYLVFLSVAATLFIVLFVQIADNYMTKLEGAVTALASAPPDASMAAKIAGMLKDALLPPDQVQMQASLNILRIVFQLVFICVPLFFIEIQLPTIVGSMTGGNGGSVGSGSMMVMQAVRTAASLAKGGGK
jgi:type IV secretion system protein VirB6